MNRETFDTLWNQGIKIKAKQMVDDNLGIVSFDNESKERILNEYNKLRDYTKMSFMSNPDGLLDRHKVCACLIYAIIKSKPLVYDDSDNINGRKYVFNENLAMTIGLSLLYNFIICGSEVDKAEIEDGFVYPKTTHSRITGGAEVTYQEFCCLMLYFDVRNKQYSILALANILFMIEEYSKLANKGGIKK